MCKTNATLGDSDHISDEIFLDVKQMNRFTIVDDPAKADLILEFSLQHSDNNYATTVFLTVRDGKTNVVLWSVGAGGLIRALVGTKKNYPEPVDQVIRFWGP